MKNLISLGILLVILLIMLQTCSENQNFMEYDSNFDDRIEVILNDKRISDWVKDLKKSFEITI